MSRIVDDMLSYIGARHEKICSRISTLNGRELDWVDGIRYVGVFIVRANKFICSIDQAKRAFFRAANSIFLPKLVGWPLQLLKQIMFANFVIWFTAYVI